MTHCKCSNTTLMKSCKNNCCINCFLPQFSRLPSLFYEICRQCLCFYQTSLFVFVCKKLNKRKFVKTMLSVILSLARLVFHVWIRNLLYFAFTISPPGYHFIVHSSQQQQQRCWSYTPKGRNVTTKKFT